MDLHHRTPWARPLLPTDPGLVAELAVWRTALHIDDTDPRPTGPRRYPILERTHQRHLDTRINDALGDTQRAATRWADTLRAIEPRILADPYWPVIADRIDSAARAGIDITAHLTHAAALRPLPDDLPAAALWSRLEADLSTLDNAHHPPTDLPRGDNADSSDRIHQNADTAITDYSPLAPTNSRSDRHTRKPDHSSTPLSPGLRVDDESTTDILTADEAIHAAIGTLDDVDHDPNTAEYGDPDAEVEEPWHAADPGYGL